MLTALLVVAQESKSGAAGNPYPNMPLNNNERSNSILIAQNSKKLLPGNSQNILLKKCVQSFDNFDSSTSKKK